jgi:hypothetical protein
MSGDLMGCSATSGIQGTLDTPSTVKKMVKIVRVPSHNGYTSPVFVWKELG